MKDDEEEDNGGGWEEDQQWVMGKKITLPCSCLSSCCFFIHMTMAHRIDTLPEKFTKYEDILISRSVTEVGAETSKLVCAWRHLIA